MPLSVVQRLARAYIGTEKRLLESARYSRLKGQILSRVVKPSFAGYWICRGISPEPLDPKEADVVFLYIHGGGYAIGHPYGTAPELLLIAELLAKENITCSIFALEYTLVPNACFPTQIDQAMSAYDWLVEDMKVDCAKLSMLGESAGGHLIVSLLVALHERFQLHSSNASPSHEPAASAFLLSPWLDLYNTNPKLKEHSDQSAVNHDLLSQWADLLLKDTPPSTRNLYTNFASPKSPLNWQAILPDTTWISYGTKEPLFLYDVLDFAERARKDGANVIVEAEEGAEHAWQSQQAMKHHKAFLLQPAEVDDENLMLGYRKLIKAMIQIVGRKKIH